MNGEQTGGELPDDVIRQIQKIVRETINAPPEPAEEGGAEAIREGDVLRVIVRAKVVTRATVTPSFLTLRVNTAEVKRWDLDKIRRFIDLLTSILMFFHAAEVTLTNGAAVFREIERQVALHLDLDIHAVLHLDIHPAETPPPAPDPDKQGRTLPPQ